MGLQAGEELPTLDFVLRQGLVEQRVPVRVERAGVVGSLPDVQADDDRESGFHDAVLPWSITTGRSLDTSYLSALVSFGDTGIAAFLKAFSEHSQHLLGRHY